MTLEGLLKTPAWKTTNYRKLEERCWLNTRDLVFDSKEGSKFWLERAEKFNVRPSDFSTLQEFLGHMISDYDESIIKNNPPEYFRPKGTKKSEVELHTSSGSKASKKETTWSKIGLNYAAMYGDYVFDSYGIPENMDWLVTGTLLFYELMKRTVEIRGGNVHAELVPTRGAKRFIDEAAKMVPEEFVKTPFYEHRVKPVDEFYLETLKRCNIGGLVATLFMLPSLSHAEGFENVKVIYPSGMEIPFDELEKCRKQFPDKTFLTSYGHHQIGLAFASPKFSVPTYYSAAPLFLVYVVKEDNPFKLVEYGERGKNRIIRMDNLLWVQTERDYSERVEPYGDLKWDGFRNVKPTW